MAGRNENSDSIDWNRIFGLKEYKNVDVYRAAFAELLGTFVLLLFILGIFVDSNSSLLWSYMI